MLDAGVRRLELQMTRENPVVRAELLQAAGTAYRGIGEYQEAARLVGVSVALRMERAAEDPAGYARALLALALLRRDQGNYEGAAEIGREAVELMQTAGTTDDRAQAAELASARVDLAEILRRPVGIPLTITVYANPVLMVSRIPLKGIKPDRPFLSDRGDAYRVVQSGGLTTVRPEQDFSLCGHVAELRAMGCGRFLVELAHVGPFSPVGQE